MKPVVLSLAKNDLKEIHDRLIEFGNIPPAKFRDSFVKFCNNVACMPLMYPQYDHIPNYRKAVIEYDYIVFYKVENVGSMTRARVYRVLHGKRDIASFLDDE